MGRVGQSRLGTTIQLYNYTDYAPLHRRCLEVGGAVGPGVGAAKEKMR